MPLTDAANVPLLLIFGGDDADRAVRIGSKIRVSGSTNLWKVFAHEPYHRLHATRNFLRQARRPDLTPYRCLVNLITEPERNVRSLENLRKILRGVPGKVLNPPEAVLRTTREQVAQRLAGVPGLVVPPAVRVSAAKAGFAAKALDKAGVKFPVMLRAAGTHGGKIIGCFEDVESLLAALDGAKEHIATQFIDFQSADGLYRKYRVFFIGSHLVFRHMLISDHWNIHAKDRARYMADRPALIAEERGLFESGDPFSPKVKQVLLEVRQRMPLDFFGMDFGIMGDEQVVLFEANAAMNFFPFSPDPQFAYLQQCFKPAQSAFQELLGLPQPSLHAPMLQWRAEPAR